MKRALEQFFGCKVEINENGKKLSSPVYLAMRPISIVEMNGVRFAVVDITNRKAAGEHVNERDLKKHKYDVFRFSRLSGLMQKSIQKVLLRTAYGNLLKISVN